jgi:hypothetical protein
MVEWEVTSAGLRVYDGTGAVVTVDAPDLDVSGTGTGLPRPVETAVDCALSEVRLPVAVVRVATVDGDQHYELANDRQPLELPAGEYVVDVDAELKTYLQVEGPLSLRKTAEFDEVVLSLPERRRVTLGFRSRHDRPPGTVTVEPTPAGLAEALSYGHATHATTTPDRSYPTLRGHPPLFEVGDQTDVPAAVAEATPDPGVEVRAPASLPDLFVLAPLAHYLQAEVVVEDREAPLVTAPAADHEFELRGPPDLERDVTRTLRKTFLLDCLVRNAGPYGTNLAESSLLDALGLDAGRLYDLDPPARLAAYGGVPYDAVERRLPDWHLSAYVEPTVEYVETLPFLLDSLSLVYTPETSELSGSELVERSLGDFYRSDAGQVPSVDILKPELRSSRIHGWLADGVPIDVFKSSPAAYRNRLAALDGDADTTTIRVVLNDEEMYGEHHDVEETYRTRGTEIPVEVDLYEHLTVAELADVFEAESDFVHYIGHCEEFGLRCPDGYMDAADLQQCGADAFFLNACGSYYEGRKLVEAGAVGGAITFSQVLNEHAVKVGSAFARLLVHGFSLERAMQLARRRIMMGKDYAVVGDGTHAVTQNENRLPASATLEKLGEEYLLSYDQYSTRHTGGYYTPYVEGNEYSYLCGNEAEFALDHAEVLDFLRRAEMPVVHDGDVYWSSELCEQLRDGE